MTSARSVSRPLAFVAGAFPVTFAFGYLPVDLYGRNLQALGGDVWLAWLYVAFGLVLLIPIALLCLSRRLAPWVADLLFALGLFLLLSDWLAPVQVARLDGARFGSTEPVLYTAIEIGIALAVLVLLLVLPRNAVRVRTQAVVSAVLVLYVAASLVLLPGKPAEAAPSPPAPASSTLPNIYQFHLDELQSDFALAAMTSPEFASAFDGFTFFRRNISNYPYTQPSVPSYLTSSIYRSGGYLDWVKNFDKGLLTDLKAAGYRLEVVGLPEHFQTPIAEPFRSPEQLFETDFNIRHPQLVDFTSLWFARLLPNTITNDALLWGTEAGQTLSGWLDTRLGDDVPRTVEQGMSPFQAVNALDHLRKDEAGAPDHGRYLLVQAILPHAPYVMDGACRFDPDTTVPVDRQYAAQATCSIREVALFLAELKRLGRYDSSVVIIQSDHGYGWAGFEGTDAAVMTGASELFGPGLDLFAGVDGVGRRAMATFSIKPVGAGGVLRISDAPSELLDVYPTVMDLVALGPQAQVEGVSLAPCVTSGACSAAENRDRYFYAFPADAPGTNIVRRKVTSWNGEPIFAPMEPVTITGR